MENKFLKIIPKWMLPIKLPYEIFIASVIVIVIVIAFIINLIKKPVHVKNLSESSLNNENGDSYSQLYPGGNSKNTTSVKMNGNKFFAFYVPWDENSKTSLMNNIKKIDVAIPEWFHLKRDMTISSDKQIEIDTFIQENGVKEMPLINNIINEDWDGQIVHNMISSQEKRSRFVKELAALVKSGGYYGINIDFENLDSKDKNAYTEFIKELCSNFHNSGYYVSVDLPPNSNDTYDYKAISGYCDYLIIMLYDEHYSTGTPGPIASQKWFETQLNSVIPYIPKDKMVAALGNYGYDWTMKSSNPAKSITYLEALNISVKKNKKIIWDPNKLNPHYTYKDGVNNHTVWFLDSVTFYNELKYSIEKGIPNIALWRLGSEDQKIWDFVN